MEFLSAHWFSALFAIVIIDLVLAGDNAIVIAMAACNLPEKLRKKAILYGALGAVALRTLMTIGVMYLLHIPGLRLVGGLVLLWIACCLLGAGVTTSTAKEPPRNQKTFWGAMKMIVVADAVMGIDNVLGVAGAAHGAFNLVLTGLLISIPIVVWGSMWVLKLINRFPIIIYIGATVLAYTAANLIITEPLLKEMFAEISIRLITYVSLIAGVLGAGWFMNHRFSFPKRG